MKKPIFILTPMVLIAITILAWVLTAASSPDIQNVILISIDTCRADHLSCYGCKDQTTPNIDALAKEATLFANTVSPVPITLPAHASMLTGTIPPHHGLHNNMSRLAPSNLTLAEILKPNGFNTAAIVSASALDKQFGLAQGFDIYHDRFKNIKHNIFGNERTGDETTKAALNFLDINKDEKNFLFLHYNDPHAEYTPPEPFASKFDNPYAGEIAFTDHCIGQVIQKLKDLGLYDSTLLIVTGSHGEMLGEHGEDQHEYYIYQAAIKVPLIVKLPGQTKPQTVTQPVGLVDILPTVCSALSIAPPANIQGRDITSLIRKPSKQHERYSYSESLTPTRLGGNSLMSITTKGYKYIQTTRPELYDLNKDPGETNNLFTAQPKRARALRDKLRQKLDQAVRQDTDSKLKLGPEAIKRLESLGCIADKANKDFTFDREKEDPKDLIAFFSQFQRSKALAGKDQFGQAKEMLEKLKAQRPAFSEIYSDLGSIAIQQKDYEQAVLNYDFLLKQNPNDTKALHDLAAIMIAQQKPEQAIRYLTSALKLSPNDVSILNSLTGSCCENEQYDLAIKYGIMATNIEPRNAGSNFSLAIAYKLNGNLDLAIMHFRQTLAIAPNDIASCNNIAEILASRNNPAAAVAYYTKSLSISSNQLSTINDLAWLFATNPDVEPDAPQSALILATKLCKVTDFKDPNPLDTLASAYAANAKFPQAIITAQQALDIANEKGLTNLATQIKNRLDLYKQNKPYRN